MYDIWRNVYHSIWCNIAHDRAHDSIWVVCDYTVQLESWGEERKHSISVLFCLGSIY